MSLTVTRGSWPITARARAIPGGFYGNMFGYHDVTDPSDDAMLPPLCWITNSFDRSPAELLWVTSDQWGPLKGALLNTSYGYGMVYVVPHEKVGGQLQGGVNGQQVAVEFFVAHGHEQREQQGIEK